MINYIKDYEKALKYASYTNLYDDTLNHLVAAVNSEPDNIKHRMALADRLEEEGHFEGMPNVHRDLLKDYEKRKHVWFNRDGQIRARPYFTLEDAKRFVEEHGYSNHLSNPIKVDHSPYGAFLLTRSNPYDETHTGVLLPGYTRHYISITPLHKFAGINDNILTEGLNIISNNDYHLPGSHFASNHRTQEDVLGGAEDTLHRLRNNLDLNYNYQNRIRNNYQEQDPYFDE